MDPIVGVRYNRTGEDYDLCQVRAAYTAESDPMGHPPPTALSSTSHQPTPLPDTCVIPTHPSSATHPTSLPGRVRQAARNRAAPLYRHPARRRRAPPPGVPPRPRVPGARQGPMEVYRTDSSRARSLPPPRRRPSAAAAALPSGSSAFESRVRQLARLGRIGPGWMVPQPREVPAIHHSAHPPASQRRDDAQRDLRLAARGGARRTNER